MTAMRAMLALAALALATTLGQAGATERPLLIETPMYRSAVEHGTMPPIADRLPDDPLVVDLEAEGLEPGRPGGTLHTLIDKPKSIRYIVAWGYARLVGYTPELELEPDILKSVEIADGRIFTLHLRKGHKWSDGHPFTAEDFRYYWEDVANNDVLTPTGPPSSLRVDGEPPVFEVLDETTVRYSWSKPNPTFLQELARARPPFIYRPAHYLKQFHEKYGDPEVIAKMVEREKVRNWASLHNRMDNMYNFDNADEPTLQPWVNTTKLSTTRYTMARNPYFHRVTAGGHQLPFIDKVVMDVAAARLIPAMTAAGQSELQARGLGFSDLAILKQNERRDGFRVLLWPSAKSAQIALYPNLNYKDPVWRRLFRSADFRRALSLGIDRYLISRTLYLGLAEARGNTVLPQSPLFDREHARRWADYDPERANALLDGLGLTERNSRGIRLLPDGRPAEIIVETAGENLEEVDALQLITEDWQEIGIKLLIKPSQRDVLRERAYTGSVMMTVWSGWDNGIPTADMVPDELAPVHQDNLAWPMWGQYYETGGQSGEPPDMEAAERLMALYRDWFGAETRAERQDIWDEMLAINTREQFVIGIVSEVPQPVVVSRKLHNVPEEGFYGWDPGAQFGIYRPDQFWLDE